MWYAMALVFVLLIGVVLGFTIAVFCVDWTRVIRNSYEGRLQEAQKRLDEERMLTSKIRQDANRRRDLLLELRERIQAAEGIPTPEA